MTEETKTLEQQTIEYGEKAWKEHSYHMHDLARKAERESRLQAEMAASMRAEADRAWEAAKASKEAGFA